MFCRYSVVLALSLFTTRPTRSHHGCMSCMQGDWCVLFAVLDEPRLWLLRPWLWRVGSSHDDADVCHAPDRLLYALCLLLPRHHVSSCRPLVLAVSHRLHTQIQAFHGPHLRVMSADREHMYRYCKTCIFREHQIFTIFTIWVKSQN